MTTNDSSKLALLTENYERLKTTIIELSFPRFLLATGILLVIINVIWFFLPARGCLDFRHFYAIDAAHLLSGHIPFIHYTPWYPLLAEFYFLLFGIFGMNPTIARIFQSLIFFACMIVVWDIMKQMKIKSKNWRLIWFIVSPVLILFVIDAINNDILMILFLMLAFDFFLRDNPLIVGLSIGLGVMVKIFPVILIIPLGLYYLKNKKIKSFVLMVLGTVGIFLAVYLPFSILKFIIFNESVTWIFINLVYFFLSPLMMPEGHPLNLPYFFLLPLIPYTSLTKSMIKMAANVVAFSLIIGYSVWQVRKDFEPIDAIKRMLIPVLFIFFIFQPYIAIWYFPWVLIPSYLLDTSDTFKENYVYQFLVYINCIVAVNIYYVFNAYVVDDLYYAQNYEFFVFPFLVIPMVINMLHMLLQQLTAVLIYTRESRIKRYLVLPSTVGVLILAWIGYFFLRLYV
ncbi:MAG: glycosyltransferase 87 family protein [Candidatus Helarchaeota archaeon]